MSLIEIPDPPGYKVVGYRPPKQGEMFMEGLSLLARAGHDYEHRCYPILEPVEVWRDATLDDLKRAPISARFRDGSEWMLSKLVGYRCSNQSYKWMAENETYWKHCQVLEVPNE